MPNLTDRYLKSLPTRTSRYEVRDSAIPGFCAIVRPSGTKSFCFRYRMICSVVYCLRFISRPPFGDVVPKNLSHLELE